MPALLSAYHRGQFPVQVQVDPHDLTPSIPIEAIDSEGSGVSKIPDNYEGAGASTRPNVSSQGPEEIEELHEEGAQENKIEEADSAEGVVENAGDPDRSGVEDQQEDLEVHMEHDPGQSASAAAAAAADGEAESPRDDTDVQNSGPTEFDATASGDEIDHGLLDKDGERDGSNPEVVEDAVRSPGGEPGDAGIAESMSSTTQAESIELSSVPDGATVNQRVPSNGVDAEKDIVVVVPPTQEEGEGESADDQDGEGEQSSVSVSEGSTASGNKGVEEDYRDDHKSEAADDLAAPLPDTSTSSKGPFRRLMDRFWPGSGKNGKA